MEIKHNLEKQRFELWKEQEEIGWIAYEIKEENNYYAISTKVYPEYNGHGYAGMLVDALSNYVKDKKGKVVPVCPYVIKRFEKYPEKYKDVI